MIDIGWPELLLVAVITVVVVGRIEAKPSRMYLRSVTRLARSSTTVFNLAESPDYPY